MDLSNFHEIHYVTDIDSDSITSQRVSVSTDLYSDSDELDYIGEYIPSPGDVIYFLPGCSVPRMKLLDYCDKHSITVTKTPEKASVVFSGPGTKSQFFSSIKGTFLSKASYMKWLEVCRTDEATEFIDKELEDVRSAPGDKVFLGSMVKDLLDGTEICPWLEENVSVNLDDLESGNYMHVRDEVQLVKLRKCSGKIHSQDDLLIGLNERVINERMYQELRSMLSSGERDNWTVAVELMANCHYQKSIAYLILLMREFSGQGGTITSTKASGHVNFTAFKEYLGINNDEDYSGDYILELLSSKRQLTLENVNIVKRAILEDIQTLMEKKQMRCFRVLDIALTEEYLSSNMVKEEQHA